MNELNDLINRIAEQVDELPLITSVTVKNGTIVMDHVNDVVYEATIRAEGGADRFKISFYLHDEGYSEFEEEFVEVHLTATQTEYFILTFMKDQPENWVEHGG